MRVNTNVSAINTLRQLDASGRALGKSIGRLSSGFRINTASDDAAGLGIANKMRADIRSLQQAGRNAEQATSLLQVAEGAAQTIQNILERMKELATQAGSDNVDSAGRTSIHAEFTKLSEEITRIVNTTEFQNAKLLDGSMGGAVTADLSGVGFDATAINGTQAGDYDVTHAADGTVTFTDADGHAESIVTVDGAGSYTFEVFGITVTTDASYVAADAAFDGQTFTVAGTDSEFMVSSSGAYDGDDLVTVTGMDLRLATLGIDASDLSDRDLAQAALAAIDTAIGTVSSVFGDIGAAQNRIEYARSNTVITVENFQAAESVIRDADMAFEVTQMTKFQILQQAGTAVLAQANQTTQGVLALLR
jgi:flagellin